MTDGRARERGHAGPRGGAFLRVISGAAPVALAALGLLSVVTCASLGQGPATPAASSSSARAPVGAASASSSAATPHGAAPVAGSSGSAAGSASAPPSVGPPPSDGPLAPFHRALASLAAGTRGEPVRILWMGDSHTAADFLTDAVRAHLQERFGDGGPGFLRLGVRQERHARVSSDIFGSFARTPRAPSSSLRVEDGFFGLGGYRVVAEPMAKVRLSVRRVPASGLRWDLAHRLTAAPASFLVAVDGKVVRHSITDGGLQHLVVDDDAGVFELSDVRGGVELFGVVAEARTPGVVLDTAGINGAMLATILAWDTEAWVAEVERRAPELVVFAYGTNEVFSPFPPEKFARDLAAVVGLVRRDRPERPCFVLGPSDVQAGVSGSHERVAPIDEALAAAASELGCGYFSVFSAMGGVGGYARWRAASPQLAAGDRVHLLPVGYERVGSAVAERLLDEADAAAQGALPLGVPSAAPVASQSL